MENEFQYLKRYHLANCVFDDVDDVWIGVRKVWLDFEESSDHIGYITNGRWATDAAVQYRSSARHCTIMQRSIVSPPCAGFYRVAR